MGEDATAPTREPCFSFRHPQRGPLARLLTHVLVKLLVLAPLPPHIQARAALFPISVLWVFAEGGERAEGASLAVETGLNPSIFPDGRIKSHTDALGNTIQYQHDLTGRQELVYDRNTPPGLRVLTYDDRGNVIKEVDPEGKVILRTFTARNNRKSETVRHDPSITNPPATLYTYEGDGTAAETDNLASITDPNGHTTTNTYNARGQVTTTRDARGHFTVNTYDASGNLLQTEVRATTGGPALSRTASTYFPDGSVKTQRVWTDLVTDTFCETAYEYFPGGLLKKQIDPSGHATEYTYDRSGNQRTRKTTRTLPSGQVETLLTEYVYDRMDRLTKTIDPDGTYTETVYDAEGHQRETLDKKRRKTTYGYDDMGRLVRTTYPDLTFEETTYWPEGQRKTFQDRRGKVTSYTYDAADRLKTTTYPDGATTENFYDAAGRLEKVRDARGNITKYEYFDNGQRKAVNVQIGGTAEAPVFARTSYTYDGNGNVETMTDARGKTTTYVYDERNRRIRTSFPPPQTGDSPTTAETGYDAAGRRVFETDQAGKTTRFGYDCLGRLTSVSQRNAGVDLVTTYGYNEVGERTSQTDANQHTTRFEYDKLGRETARILPDGKREEKTYDAAGNLARKVDFAARETLYGYDDNDRLTSRTYTGASSENVGVTYTKTGRLETVTDRFGTTTQGYDLRDRLASILYASGAKLEMSHDGNGNRETLTAYPVVGDPIPATFRYDDASRLDQVTDVRLKTYGLAYDLNGNRETLSQPNGVVTTYVYNALNRLTNLATVGAVGTVQSYALTLGPTGNRTKITLAGGVERGYAYDDLYRLTQEKWTDAGAVFRQDDLTYDNVGNRLTRTLLTSSGTATTSYTYDERDRLRTENLTSYSYDDNGNLTTKDGEATYTWDRENRLTKVSKTDGTIVEYAYDAFGNRLQTKTAKPGQAIETVNYVVDTSGSLSHVVAELDEAGRLKTYYLRADNELIGILRPDGAGGYTAKYPHADHIGSIRVLTDDSGQVQDTYEYDAWGTLLQHVGSDPQPYAFAGEPYDPNALLAYHRARWYAASVGRFVATDPFLGFQGDPRSLHRYSYASGDPVNAADPTGQMSTEFVVAVSLTFVIAAIAYPVLRAVIAGSRPVVVDFEWRNQFRETLFAGGRSLRDDEIETVKFEAFLRMREAYQGTRIIVSVGGGGTNHLEVKDRTTGGPNQAGSTVGIRATRSEVSYSAAAEYAWMFTTAKDPNVIVPGIGRAVGSIAAHEFAHQLGVPWMDQNRDPNAWDYYAADEPSIAYGARHWIPQNQEWLLKHYAPK